MQQMRYQGTPWKLALALVVGTFLAGMATTMTIAAHRVAPVTDADYYNRGLHYGQTASGAQNPGLHWTMSASLADGELQVRVRDRSGAPVSGGELRFEPKRATGTGLGAHLALSESPPGTYRAPRPATPQGELHGTLRFTKGEAAASQKLVLFN